MKTYKNYLYWAIMPLTVLWSQKLNSLLQYERNKGKCKITRLVIRQQRWHAQYFDLPRDSDIVYIRYKREWCGNGANNLFYRQKKSLILRFDKAIILSPSLLWVPLAFFTLGLLLPQGFCRSEPISLQIPFTCFESLLKDHSLDEAPWPPCLGL